MSILKRLKRIEKIAVNTGVDKAADADLTNWLKANTYNEDLAEDFYAWSNRIPERLVKPFTDYLKRNIKMGCLNISRDWVGV